MDCIIEEKKIVCLESESKSKSDKFDFLKVVKVVVIVLVLVPVLFLIRLLARRGRVGANGRSVRGSLVRMM